MSKKPLLRKDRIIRYYDEGTWSLLRKLRARSIQLMSALKRFDIESIVHGSIARGDVSPESDIDILIPSVIPSYIIEMALEEANLPAKRRLIVQATPFYAIKGYLEIDEREVVSFPLVKFRPREMDFYKFGGCLDLQGLESGERVPGVDKRLMLIEPIPEGHIESSIIGQEDFVAKLLGISVDVIRERVNVLLRRDKIGRTGVFLKREVPSEETFEGELRKLARAMPTVRKRLAE